MSFNSDNFLACANIWICQPELAIPSVNSCEILDLDTNLPCNLPWSSINVLESTKRKLFFKKSKEFPIEEDVFLFRFEHSDKSFSKSETDDIHSSTQYDIIFLFVPLSTTEHCPVYPQGIYYGFEFNACSLQIKSFQMNSRYEIIYNLNPFLNLLSDKLTKWCKNNALGYQKRVVHDMIVPRNEFNIQYSKLKEKYSCWVDKWTETTNPIKFVFEDIGIAAFLIALWNQTKLKHNRKFHFVDLGCGNGFLSYILACEGYKGYGIDLQKRKIWSQFEKNVLLEHRCICVEEETFDTEWVIGNHPDELTGHIPIISYKSQCNFFILPCCFYNLHGNLSLSLARYEGNGRHAKYLNYIESICKSLAFLPQRENLRIPSTKNVALIAINEGVLVDSIETILEKYL